MNSHKVVVEVDRPAIQRLIEEKVQQLTDHSIILNRIAWKISMALGRSPDVEGNFYGDVEADLDELLGRCSVVAPKYSKCPCMYCGGGYLS